MIIENITNPGQPPVHGDTVRYVYPNGATETKVFVSVTPVITIAYAKAAKIHAIRSHFESIIAGVKSDAAPYEIDTWDTQRAEYMAWESNNATPTPYVSGLAAARGMTVAALMAKIASKVTAFAMVQGSQHALETLVEAATTIAEVEAITF
jgi:tRNA(Ile2) C34 agmatinyltransferase TiaS